MATQNGYGNLTPKLAWQLAAPHTWPASIFPVLTAASLAAAEGFGLSASITLALLAISVLLQSAVNTINDYFDCVKGTDSEADDVEPDDAVLIYNNVNPASARNLAFGFVACALLLGIYCIWYAGWVPLVVACIGILVIFLYSGGKTPISYLPIGEIVSGFVMGALITFASYTVLTRTLNWLVLVWAIPLIIAIGLIMLTNNTCDIEKDIAAKRATLPVKIGRTRSVALYHALIVVWYVAVAGIAACWFTDGLIIVPFMLLATYPLAKALFSNPFAPGSRIAAMSQICSMNIAMGAFYCLVIVMSRISVWLL